MKRLYNPELSGVIAFLEDKIISNDYSDNEVVVYNKLIYGEKVSKRLIAWVVDKMNKELVS